MKRTGLNTWGSDILLMKPTCAIDTLKHLLSLPIHALSFLHFSYMTEIFTSSLHLWVKKNIRVCIPMMATKTVSGLFHIVEQRDHKSIGTVNKKTSKKDLQLFERILFVPYYGTINTHLLETH